MTDTQHESESTAASGTWEIWIDVGGTFTDCFALRPDGTLLRHKLLSSGVTKGAVSDAPSTTLITDPARRADPEDFWKGYQLRLLDDCGQIVAASLVSSFDATSGSMGLDTPLGTDPVPGAPYELASGEEAPLLAIRYLRKLKLHEAIPPCRVRLGTTRGTNALITRRGAKTALVTTRGFGDILRIGYQNRPRLFDLAIRKPAPLYTTVVEIDERVTHDGQVLQAPEEHVVRAQLASLSAQHIEALAICLLHGYACPDHEHLVAACARDLGYADISLSSEVARLIRIVARGDTTVVDAYLNPVLRDYVRTLREKLQGSDVRILTSAGGLVSADLFFGKDSILSGPAGGVVGFSRAARAAGFQRAIGFDMGGTSTDVSRYDGQFELEYETEKAGVRIVAPMMAIETVAAGGGSICWFDGVKLVVGPDSAGAEPGPACYGRGGPLAVTDVNLRLGKILPNHFPFPLDEKAVTARIESLLAEIRDATAKHYSPIELADGFLRIANANMAAAIRTISVAQGADPRDYLLVAFGGAAAQHACAVARELGIRRILNHPDAGILSAYGIGHADVVRHAAHGIYQPYAQQRLSDLQQTFDSLSAALRQQVLDEGVPAARIEIRRALDLRYQGLDAYLTIPCPDDGDYVGAYHAEHERRYGYVDTNRELEIVAARVQAIGRRGRHETTSTPAPRSQPVPESTTTVYFDAQPQEAAVFARSQLKPGHTITGPAVVYEYASTTVIDPGWNAEVYTGGELLLSDRSETGQIAVSTEADPIMLEIFNNRFAAIAQQMGITLRNTSSSVNVKERLDFSCAIFTPQGELVVNAPHIPVHLGAMGQTVRAVLSDNPQMEPGDVFVTNDPFRGGSHLPDITVVTPVHDPHDGRLLFFTASRAHHAETGGVRPGSMPPFSRNLAEEGVLIRNFKLVSGDRHHFDQLRELLLAGDYPTRAVEDNLADIAAQLAANRQGANDLMRLIERYSLPVVAAYMRHIQDAAEQKMRRALARLPDGRYQFVDYLEANDCSVPIQVALTIDEDVIGIDFTGTAPVLAGNLNANRAIVTAAIMYVLRCLIDEDIPLNEGVLAPVSVTLPTCMLNPPPHESPEACAAVSGGNVETSQRIVDVLLGALGVAAASQGTMNNVLFGDKSFGYYETICGGAGATPVAPGADAVHTHMTNTRLTDVEVLEKRYPVRVQEFSIRRGSGGAGQHCGGDGVLRRLEFLSDVQVSILSQRRGPHPPYGLAGGEPGALGRNTLSRADGRVEPLSGQIECDAHAGDVLAIETPGGGGYGASE